MVQEVELVIQVKSDFFSLYNKESLPAELSKYKVNEHTIFEIVNLFNNELTIKINTGIRATWDIKENIRFLNSLWVTIFKPFDDYIIWNIKLISLKEEAEIYGNK